MIIHDRLKEHVGERIEDIAALDVPVIESSHEIMTVTEAADRGYATFGNLQAHGAQRQDRARRVPGRGGVGGADLRSRGAAGIDGERMMKQSAPFETVTKLEALERQLRVAIRMFFERKDMIVVHTLVGASQDALRQLGSARGVASMYDHAEKVIRRDKVKDFVNALRKAQIFFKHASSGDSDEKLKFYYSVTQFLLFDAALLCSALTGRLTPEVRTFLAWFIAKFPDVYIGDDREFKAALQADIDLDDFNIPLSVIEHMNKYGLPKVNTKST